MRHNLQDAHLIEAGDCACLTRRHVSKLKHGHVNPQLANVVELTRGLNLELRLTPRKALPAVDNVVRSTIPEIIQQCATPPKMALA